MEQSKIIDTLETYHRTSSRSNRSSTKRTAPPRSAHVQLDEVPCTLDPVEAEGEFRQHDGVAMVMMMLPAQGFA